MKEPYNAFDFKNKLQRELPEGIEIKNAEGNIN